MLLASVGWHLLDEEVEICPISGVKTLSLQHTGIQV